MSMPPGVPTAEELFLENLPLIEEIIAHTCRPSGLRREDAEDFAGFVRLKLIQDDYAVFRKYQGRSSMRTYLVTTIKHLALDYKDKIWGKWRPSAEAERLGPVAVALERLLARDGVKFSEACRILRSQGVTLSVNELADLWVKLPPRSFRQFVGEDQIQLKPSGELDPYERLEQKELFQGLRRAYAALSDSLATLSKEEQILVRMRSELKVSEIARLRKIDQKPLYRKLEKAYAKLQKEMARRGVRREGIRELLRRIQPGSLYF
jgi:RNA polymerase sigma factor for flagellar operon FliA